MASGVSLVRTTTVQERPSSPSYGESGQSQGGQTGHTGQALKSPVHIITSASTSLSPVKVRGSRDGGTTDSGQTFVRPAEGTSIETRDRAESDGPAKSGSQPDGRILLKRCRSFGGMTDVSYRLRKRRRNDGIVLPTKFLLGGNIGDPLNLASLDMEAEQVTPHSSPLPTPKHKREIEVLIPANINDPLNLNGEAGDTEVALISPKGKTRCRKRRRKRTESETTNEDDEEPPTVAGQSTEEPKAVAVALKPPQKPLHLNLSCDVKLSSERKIVSPVIPQGQPRRKMSQKLDKEGPKESPVIKPPQPHFRQKDAKFKYGNYNRYYGYRNPDRTTDVRLAAFKTEWFEGKTCLDIGCNVGHVTLTLARDYRPTKMVGLDIDESLVRTARKNINHFTKNSRSTTVAAPTPLSTTESTPTAVSTTVSEPTPVFPANVSFSNENYVLDGDQLLAAVVPEYHTILCLSVTKWIHLNFGDDGLKRFFRRVYRHLHPGGIFILEAQPWCSYLKKKSLTESIFNTFQGIKMRPETFNAYLLSDEVGFESCHLIDTPAHHSKGFRRPIFLLTKSSNCT